MRRHIRKRTCLPCTAVFDPEYRHVGRQRYCSQPPCRKVSTTDRQRRWLQKPDNREHCRGPDHVKRVPPWRQDNPGYWRRKAPQVSQEPAAVPETWMPQDIDTQQVHDGLTRDAWHASLFTQPAVVYLEAADNSAA
jgi:hypothetical protein